MTFEIVHICQRFSTQWVLFVSVVCTVVYINKFSKSSLYPFADFSAINVLLFKNFLWFSNFESKPKLDVQLRDQVSCRHQTEAAMSDVKSALIWVETFLSEHDKDDFYPPLALQWVYLPIWMIILIQPSVSWNLQLHLILNSAFLIISPEPRSVLLGFSFCINVKLHLHIHF